MDSDLADSLADCKLHAFASLVPPTRGNSGSPLPEGVGPRELLGSTRRGWERPIETIPVIGRAPKAEIRPKVALLWKVDVVQQRV